MSKDWPGWLRGMLQGAADFKAEKAQKPPPPPQPPKNGNKK